MRLLALALKSPGSWKSSTPPSRKTLPTPGLRGTQVTTATGAGSSHSPRWGSRWDLTSGLAKDDEILISCIRCRSQAGLTVVHQPACFCWVIRSCHYITQPNSPPEHLILPLIIKQTLLFFVFCFFYRKWHSVLRVSLMLRINQDSIYTLHYWEIGKQIILNT